MAANISSMFTIVVDEILSNSAKTVTNPGRTFTVVSVLATGANAANVQVRKNSGTGVVVAGPTALATGDLNDFPLSLTKANLTFAADDDVYIVELAGNTISRVVLLCESGTPEALTVT